MRLRLRGPAGTTQTVVLPAGSSVGRLKAEACRLFSITTAELLLGYPPAVCTALSDELLDTLVRNGDAILVRAAEAIQPDVLAVLTKLQLGTCPERVSFANIAVGDDGIKRVATAMSKLSQGDSVTTILCFNSGLGDTGAEALAQLLSRREGVHTLTMSVNQVGPKGCAALGEALKCNNTLQVLDLSHNLIDDDAVTSLAEALEVNRGLEKLRLNNNSIGNTGALRLAAALRANDTLRTLDLCWNDSLGDAGAREVLDAIEANDAIREFDMRKAGWLPDTADRVEQVRTEKLKPILALAGSCSLFDKPQDCDVCTELYSEAKLLCQRCKGTGSRQTSYFRILCRSLSGEIVAEFCLDASGTIDLLTVAIDDFPGFRGCRPRLLLTNGMVLRRQLSGVMVSAIGALVEPLAGSTQLSMILPL